MLLNFLRKFKAGNVLTRLKNETWSPCDDSMIKRNKKFYDLSAHSYSSASSSGMHPIYGDHVIRKAVSDEEYNMVAKLRAEGLYSSMAPMEKLVVMEHNALRKQCVKDEFHCIIAVRMNEVIAAMDLIVELNFLQDICQSMEEDSLKCVFNHSQSIDSYATKLVVAKEHRRYGIASNLMDYATLVAKFRRMENMFAQIVKDNKPSLECSIKKGFKIVACGSSSSKDDLLLVWKCLKAGTTF